MLGNYFGGLDFGTSGVRITIINNKKDIIYSSSHTDGYDLNKPKSWILICEALLSDIPYKIKQRLKNLNKNFGQLIIWSAAYRKSGTKSF